MGDNMRHLEFICLFLGTLLLLGCEGSSSCNGCNCPQIIRLNPAKDSNTTVITSPSFPSKYPKNQNCKWTINATKGKLRLTFDKFKMEWSQNCKKDFLFVGNDNGAQIPIQQQAGKGWFQSHNCRIGLRAAKEN